MIKRVTIQFDIEIADKLLAGRIIKDEDVIEQLKEAYNDYIRTDGCSDATIKIEPVVLTKHGKDREKSF